MPTDELVQEKTATDKKELEILETNPGSILVFLNKNRAVFHKEPLVGSDRRKVISFCSQADSNGAERSENAKVLQKFLEGKKAFVEVLHLFKRKKGNGSIKLQADMIYLKDKTRAYVIFSTNPLTTLKASGKLDYIAKTLEKTDEGWQVEVPLGKIKVVEFS
jgi:hypothetical protein